MLDPLRLETPEAVRDAHRRALLSSALLYAIDAQSRRLGWDELTSLRAQVIALHRQNDEMFSEMLRLRMLLPISSDVRRPA